MQLVEKRREMAAAEQALNIQKEVKIATRFPQFLPLLDPLLTRFTKKQQIYCRVQHNDNWFCLLY